MIQATQPAAATVTRMVTATDGTRPMRDRCRNATTGLRTNVRMTANARGIRISRARYSAAMVPNSMTIAHLLELGRTGAEPLRSSAALVAGALSGRLWNNCRFQKEAMLEAAQADAGEPARPDRCWAS